MMQLASVLGLKPPHWVWEELGPGRQTTPAAKALCAAPSPS